MESQMLGGLEFYKNSANDRAAVFAPYLADTDASFLANSLVCIRFADQYTGEERAYADSFSDCRGIYRASIEDGNPASPGFFFQIPFGQVNDPSADYSVSIAWQNGTAGRLDNNNTFLQIISINQRGWGDIWGTDPFNVSEFAETNCDLYYERPLANPSSSSSSLHPKPFRCAASTGLRSTRP